MWFNQLFLASLGTTLAQYFADLNPIHVQGVVTGMGVGLLVGMIMWPVTREPDVSIRVMLGGIVGAIIMSIVEAVRLGQSLSVTLGSTIGSSPSPGDALVTQRFLTMFENILLAIAGGSIIMALFMAPTRALTGALLGLIIGAVAGLLAAIGFAAQLPLTSILFRALVGLLTMAIFLFAGRRG